MLEQMLTQAEVQKNDLVFFNGDMLSEYEKEEDIFVGFMDVSVKSFARQTPMYFARGNHEARGHVAPFFQHYFSPLSDKLYYLVRQGPVCFVVLDSGEDKPDSSIEFFGINDFDVYRAEEIEWLKEALKSSIFRDAPFKVAICHEPPRKDGQYGMGEILTKFVPLLNEAGIDVMLSGHLHQHIKEAANSQVKFPVLINSNTAYVKGSVTAKTLNLEVFTLDGKKADAILIKK
jgi:predicted phosphohydrolase